MQDFGITRQVGSLEANRTVKGLLWRRLRARYPRQRISVTDLLSLKQAYFQRKHPEITPPLERQQMMWAGIGFHDLFGAAVSREEYLEQLVEAEGVVGWIDIYEALPVEVKTTTGRIDETDLLRRRPGYIEQLGMYCAMVEVNQGS